MSEIIEEVELSETTVSFDVSLGPLDTEKTLLERYEFYLDACANGEQ